MLRSCSLCLCVCSRLEVPCLSYGFKIIPLAGYAYCNGSEEEEAMREIWVALFFFTFGEIQMCSWCSRETWIVYFAPGTWVGIARERHCADSEEGNTAISACKSVRKTTPDQTSRAGHVDGWANSTVCSEFQVVLMDELLKNQVFATHAIAAAGSVAFGTALTYPLDTIKVLIQVGSGSNKQLTAAQVLDRVKSLSGSSGLYSGFGWLTLGRILGVGSRFGAYEILTAFYKGQHPHEANYVRLRSILLRVGFLAGLRVGDGLLYNLLVKQNGREESNAVAAAPQR
ncbi:hypothetical protein RHMOL_Rhmol05G0135900 [Rhododendron molle]|uniref:Uncharacterized protein n=1 Tax=Rhododendron molle TaxID=49168 RepID=A0ACC0NNX5_RHOML|nr:hypothetical protein RHMOL_Rhmol05G0135900 [Rhododendron molle]